MGHNHSHSHGHGHRHFNKKRLIYAIIITFVALILEVIGGVLSNSLALLSDAAHMFSHLFALGISYVAILLSLKPADSEKTFGYYRAEILAAFVNGLSLIIIIVAILYGAYERFRNPVDIQSTEMLIIAAIGLVVNIVTAMLLSSGSREDMNVKGAFLHALGDLISSVGVVAAAAIIYFTNLIILDTIVSILIALVIAYWAYVLIKDSAHILLEGTPKELNLKAVHKTIEEIIARPISIHHVHAWQISTNIYSLTAHVSIEHTDQHESTIFIKEIKRRLAEKYNIYHTTIQIECISCEDLEMPENSMDETPCSTHHD
jgi:cobalt-zinc-cadmium efflux system protein